MTVPILLYKVTSRGIGIRSEANTASRPVGSAVVGGQVVEIDQVVPGENGQVYLHLADNRGWIFTLSALGVTICEAYVEPPGGNSTDTEPDEETQEGSPSLPPGLPPYPIVPAAQPAAVTPAWPPPTEPPPPPAEMQPRRSTNMEPLEEPPPDPPAEPPSEPPAAFPLEPPTEPPPEPPRVSAEAPSPVAPPQTSMGPRPPGPVCAAFPALPAPPALLPARPIVSVLTGTKRCSSQNEPWRDALVNAEAAVVEELNARRELVRVDLAQAQQRFEYEEEYRSNQHQALCQERARLEAASQELLLRQDQMSQCYEDIGQMPALNEERDQAREIWEARRRQCLQYMESSTVLQHTEQEEQLQAFRVRDREADENQALQSELNQMAAEHASSHTRHMGVMRGVAAEVKALRRRLEQSQSTETHVLQRRLAQHRTLEMEEVNELRSEIRSQDALLELAPAEEAQAAASWFLSVPEPCLRLRGGR